jgi:hypothetical protein
MIDFFKRLKWECFILSITWCIVIYFGTYLSDIIFTAEHLKE